LSALIKNIGATFSANTLSAFHNPAAPAIEFGDSKSAQIPIAGGK
jgi:hypothetical protein